MHQPNAGEELSKRALLRQGEIDHVEFLASQRANRTLFFKQRANERSTITIRGQIQTAPRVQLNFAPSFVLNRLDWEALARRYQ